ncbi:MAG: hypothetical protein QE265_01795 [Rhodoferax sp.]|nr:hypothetical protein [Rhodoferax sp.]
MPTYKTVYKCCECGATSYQPVVQRAADGVLRPTGAYKCTGCRTVFPSLQAWREPRSRAADAADNKIPDALAHGDALKRLPAF